MSARAKVWSLILYCGSAAPFETTCTTIVRSFGWSCCGFFGGCGTSASSPLGVTGTITMKMISSTSSTSISGVTLMSEESPPGPPELIPIVQFLSASQPGFSPGRQPLRLCLVVGEQVQLTHAARTQGINRVHHLAVVCTLICAQIHRFVCRRVRLLRLEIGHLLAQIAQRNLIAAQEH